MHKHCQQQNAHNARQHTGDYAHHHGFHVVLEQLHLFVQWHGEADSGRREQIGDDVGALVVVVVVDAHQLQDGNH